MLYRACHGSELRCVGEVGTKRSRSMATIAKLGCARLRFNARSVDQHHGGAAFRQPPGHRFAHLPWARDSSEDGYSTVE
jgi:hypothetical protein